MLSFLENTTLICGMKFCILAVLVSVSGALLAQVESTPYTFIDAARGGREIPTVVHVPEDAEAPLRALIFGHGFTMSASDYTAWVEAMVAADFAVIMVDTETGFAPLHEEFGKDLAHVADEAAGQIPSAILPGPTAIGGHSMGGGAAWLAAAESATAGAVFGLAPAETNPSAIAAASSVALPALVLSGTADQVTPAAQHHLPIYDAAASACKSFLTLTEGSHCGYANAGTLCDLGELFFNGMSRARQQAITATALAAWLDAILRDGDWGAFADLSAADFTLAIDCALSAPAAAATSPCAFPNPARDHLTATGLPPHAPCAIVNAQGQTVLRLQADARGTARCPVHGWPPGAYVLTAAGGPPVRFVVAP